MARVTDEYLCPCGAVMVFRDGQWECPVMQQELDALIERRTDSGHVLGEPCDICNGRGFDYLGRMCRRYRKARNW